jgi:hypothetical protein
MRHSHYIRLLIMAALSFVSMYVLMYVMIDRFGNVFNNLNQFYTAGLMTAPMVVIELLLMKGMYEGASQQRDRGLERPRPRRFLPPQQATGRNHRSAVPALSDPASSQRNPHVPASANQRSEDQGVVRSFR